MSESQYRFHRLPEFDYSTPGAYFITVCTNGKRNYFWESVAALTAQPLAALPPYGCGVPLAGCERLVGEHSTAQGRWCTAALPDVSLRGAKRRGNLAVHSWITGRLRRIWQCYAAGRRGRRPLQWRVRSAIMPPNPRPARRSGSAATDAIGLYVLSALCTN